MRGLRDSLAGASLRCVGPDSHLSKPLTVVELHWMLQARAVRLDAPVMHQHLGLLHANAAVAALARGAAMLKASETHPQRLGAGRHAHAVEPAAGLCRARPGGLDAGRPSMPPTPFPPRAATSPNSKDTQSLSGLQEPATCSQSTTSSFDSFIPASLSPIEVGGGGCVLGGIPGCRERVAPMG